MVRLLIHRHNISIFSPPSPPNNHIPHVSTSHNIMHLLIPLQKDMNENIGMPLAHGGPIKCCAAKNDGLEGAKVSPCPESRANPHALSSTTSKITLKPS